MRAHVLSASILLPSLSASSFVVKVGLVIACADAMFACQIYPWDSQFLSTVKAETSYQVRRLSKHASLVLWSGTNELLPGAVTNLAPFQDYEGVRPDQWAPSGGNQVAASFIYTMGAQQLHFNTVGKTIRDIDHSRAIVPSSPSNGWLSEEMLIPDMCIHQPDVTRGAPEAPAICNPSNPARGDGHFYTQDPSVAFNSSGFLPPLKFVSENGAESYPSVRPLSSVTSVGDRWIGSEQIGFRERAGKDQFSGWGQAQLDWVVYHFGIAPVRAANSSATAGGRGFQNFLILSQLATGLGLRGMAEQFRYQKMSVELGATMGHLLWQLQDNWPGQSFGLLNYGGEWKQQLYFIRRSFASLLITAAGPINMANGTTVHLVSDLMEPSKCQVDVELWDLRSTSHTPTRSWSAAAVSVAGGGATKALAVPPAQLSVLPPDSSFLRLKASCGGGVAAQNDHFLSTNFSAARRALREPDFNVSNWGVSEGLDCTFTLAAAAPTLFVVLDAGGYAGRFSDGAFAVVPGEERVLSFTPTAAGPDERQPCQVEKLRGGFSVTSLHSLLPP